MRPPLKDEADAETAFSLFWKDVPDDSKPLIWSQVALWVILFHGNVMFLLNTIVTAILSDMQSRFNLLFERYKSSSPLLQDYIHSQLIKYLMEENS